MEFLDDLPYSGTSKGVTRERHSTSHKVIFVDNLSASFDKQGFIDLFQKYGEITDVKLLKHKTGAETGYGFVEYAKEENGKKAIRDMNYKVIGNRCIRVSRAKPSTNKVSGTNLYVENVPTDWTDEMLYTHFSTICKITKARVLINPRNEQSRGVGFVHCVSNSEARKAMKQINEQNCAEGGSRLSVKFAKIARSERNLQRAQKKEGQSLQQESTKQFIQDAGETGNESPRKHEKQDGGLRPKHNWVKYNEQQPLSQNNVSQSTSTKSSKRLTKSELKKKHRREQFLKRQKKKLAKREQQQQNSSKTKEVNNHARLKRSSNEPIPDGNPANKPKRPHSDKRGKYREPRVQEQIPNVVRSAKHTNPNVSMNHYHNQQTHGKPVQSQQVDKSVENGFMNGYQTRQQLSPPCIFQYHDGVQMAYPYDKAVSVTSTVSSSMSLAHNPVLVSNPGLTREQNELSRQRLNQFIADQRFRCASQLSPSVIPGYANMQTQSPNIQTNPLYWSGLPTTSGNWQPMGNLYNNCTDRRYAHAKGIMENQIQPSGFQNVYLGIAQAPGGSVGTGVCGNHTNIWPGRSVFPATAMVNQQQEINQQYYMPQVVNPQGVSPAIPQQCWSTASCSSVNSHIIENDDHSVVSDSVNPYLREGIMRYNNILPQNITTQVNTGKSESTVLDQLSYVQQQLGNFSACGDSQRFNTVAASTPLKGQYVGIPQPVISNVASPTVRQYQQYQCWSTASSCSSKCVSVKDEDLNIKEENVTPLKNVCSPKIISNFPVTVKVSTSKDTTTGFNHKQKVEKGVENFTFDREKSHNRSTGFNPKSKMMKTTEKQRNKDQLSSKGPHFFTKKHNKVYNMSSKLASRGKKYYPGGGFAEKREKKQAVTKNPFSGFKHTRKMHKNHFKVRGD